MGPFPNSFGNLYIFLVVDYVSKWAEAIATRTNDFKVVVDFFKANIFARFGLSRAIISDRGTHFYNRSIEALVKSMKSPIRSLWLTIRKQIAKQRFPTGK